MDVEAQTKAKGNLIQRVHPQVQPTTINPSDNQDMDQINDPHIQRFLFLHIRYIKRSLIHQLLHGKGHNDPTHTHMPRRIAVLCILFQRHQLCINPVRTGTVVQGLQASDKEYGTCHKVQEIEHFELVFGEEKAGDEDHGIGLRVYDIGDEEE